MNLKLFTDNSTTVQDQAYTSSRAASTVFYELNGITSLGAVLLDSTKLLLEIITKRSL